MNNLNYSELMKLFNFWSILKITHIDSPGNSQKQTNTKSIAFPQI